MRGIQPQGTTFWCQQKPFVTSIICYNFQKKSLWSLILYIFYDLYMYIAPGQGLTTPWGRNLMSTGTSCHFSHLLQVSKNFFWSLILHKFFLDFIYVYSSRAGADSPQGTKFWCQQKCLATSFICCKFQNEYLWSLILYNFFHDLIHVYGPGAGADSPQGTKFLCQQKGLITLHIYSKFQSNLFDVWFYTIFFMI